ncbi:RIBOSOMAL LARGE SUBUNIT PSEUDOURIDINE SYNTHASE C (PSEUDOURIDYLATE SYNTHASE) (URACIL HYDROLYASE) [Mycoplasmopsis pulmonis]|uniref:RNA pseudouridylate synthase n=1 Tax=Mycoplasmopsis pulmonis (strain UAB CTIP) TaxID=272635 RepID=Q98R93_MYCPU|nr:RluA family pseudouridine synthase [Mycoplasmopsis pulmonis]MDZ7293087.1 RluA family pseudouridine synthase [Mycoplasmopsis pulmonis]CAC13290.1 RIBOSOMAL LARGE SUBUNIT PSEUDOURIDINE SYNTHASE C (PSEUDOURIDYLATE SYNTHASE) (URACIL HYDROLYASE) [Mycoplasmopsis pulmonis]VEU67880.1 pseudouridylate synthase [Mycoplasmopsis pulmonis]
MFEFIATNNDHGRIIFKVLLSYLNNVPVSRIQKLFREKDIKVNGKRNIDKNFIVSKDDLIQIYGLTNVKQKLVFKKIEQKFNVIFEDQNILVINKQAGVSMHSDENSLDKQVLSYLNFKQVDSFVPSSIGRLDKVTSGVVVYAKNYSILKTLKSNEHLRKTYVFMSNITLEPNQKIEHVFYHKYNPIKKKAELFKENVEESKITKTLLYKVKNNNYAELITGRKHQIRATLSKLGFPIFGDVKYGGKKDKRVYLHSYKIKFHSLKGEFEYLNNQEFIAPIRW